MEAAFTLLEIVVTIALIGVVTTMAVSMIGSGMPQTVRNTRLIADISHLNQMVALYLADGGSMDGVTSEQGVLDKLKRARSSPDSKTNVGVTTGRLVDVRLRVRTSAGTMASGQSSRAYWNTSSKRFALRSSGSGVDEFYLDDSLSDAAFPVDTRDSSRLKHNSSNGWVWGSVGPDVEISYVTPATVGQTNQGTPFNPTMDLPSGSAGAGSGSGSGSGSGPGPGAGAGSGSGSGAGPTVTQLPTPSITPAGGTFTAGTFPSSVTISPNGAPGGAASVLRYRLNSSAWMAYSGSISVNSGDRIEAVNIATNAAYSDSPSAAQEYYRLVSGFTGSSGGSWTNVTGGPTLAYNIAPGDPTASVSHGNTRLDLGNGEFLDSGVPNQLTYTKNNFTSIQPNVAFVLGNLTLLNGTTFYDSEATNVTLRIDLNFSSPPLNRTVDIVLNLTNTENSTDRLASADIVEIASPQPVSFTVDGVSYTLQLSWLTLDPGAGVVQGNKFLVFEGASALAQLRATLVPNH